LLCEFLFTIFSLPFFLKMGKSAKGAIAAGAAESKAFTQRLIAEEKAKWQNKKDEAKAAAKAKADAELDEWAQRADVNSSTSVDEDQRSDDGAPQEVQDHESQPKGALSKPIKKKLEAMADIDSDTEYVDTTGLSKKKRSSKNNANLPKKFRFSPRDDNNPFLANQSEGENHPTRNGVWLDADGHHRVNQTAGGLGPEAKGFRLANASSGVQSCNH
jgi:hypothetical protein